MKSKVLLACLPNPSKNPRPNRAIKALFNSGYIVDTISSEITEDFLEVNKSFTIKAYSNSIIEKVRFKIILKLIHLSALTRLPISILRFLLKHLYKIKNKDLGIINKSNYDFILVEDLVLLPVFISNNSKVLFDSREFFPNEFDGNLWFELFEKPLNKYLCDKLLHKVDKIFTVSEGIASLYKNQYGIDMEVILSLPSYRINKSIKPIEQPIALVHHGIANRNRRLENMIEIVKNLHARYSLDLYLTGDKEYINELKLLIKYCSHIKIKEPVPFGEIHNMLTNYDAGFYYLEPTSLNTTLNLPNKFFEFIQAGLALIIGPSPEMKKITESMEIGYVFSEFKISKAIEELNTLEITDFQKFKENSSNVSKILNWENEQKKLIQLFESSLKSC